MKQLKNCGIVVLLRQRGVPPITHKLKKVKEMKFNPIQFPPTIAELNGWIWFHLFGRKKRKEKENKSNTLCLWGQLTSLFWCGAQPTTKREWSWRIIFFIKVNLLNEFWEWNEQNERSKQRRGRRTAPSPPNSIHFFLFPPMALNGLKERNVEFAELTNTSIQWLFLIWLHSHYTKTKQTISFQD